MKNPWLYSSIQSRHWTHLFDIHPVIADQLVPWSLLEPERDEGEDNEKMGHFYVNPLLVVVRWVTGGNILDIGQRATEYINITKY